MSFFLLVLRRYAPLALLTIFLSSCSAPLASDPTQGEMDKALIPPLRIVALGDSLTAGYGLEISQSYPSQLQEKLRKNGYKYLVENAGVSGDTTTQLLERTSWAVAGDPVAVVILAIGANDVFQSKNPQDIKKNLEAILDLLHSKNIPVLLAGMKAPRNFGGEYISNFEAIYSDLEKHPAVKKYIPFLLEGVALRADLNLEDRIHPNEAGYIIVTNTVYEALFESSLIKK